MGLGLVCIPVEEDVARAWWKLQPGSHLPLADGRTWQLIFPGRPGGGAGPDVRDAVLTSVQGPDEVWKAGQLFRYTGDVEFHRRASEWFTHRHHCDARYNMVILHIVSSCDNTEPIVRHDGQIVPICSILDFPLATTLPVQKKYAWPCHYRLRYLDFRQRDALLLQAGLLRFEQKTLHFLEQLRALADQSLDRYDQYLVPGLAEGLGYGRDRVLFQTIGQRLMGGQDQIPEPLGHMASPAPLDARRLRALARLVAHWRSPGIWPEVRSIVMRSVHDQNKGLQSLRLFLLQEGISLTRADILIVNVILPFARAVALIEHDRLLEEYALMLYLAHPGLPSNRVTRMMSAQLLLAHEPEGSCRQQGLHHIYRQTCQEKRCEQCLLL